VKQYIAKKDAAMKPKNSGSQHILLASLGTVSSAGGCSGEDMFAFARSWLVLERLFMALYIRTYATLLQRYGQFPDKI